jgi:hypothetical protein
MADGYDPLDIITRANKSSGDYLNQLNTDAQQQYNLNQEATRDAFTNNYTSQTQPYRIDNDNAAYQYGKNNFDSLNSLIPDSEQAQRAHYSLNTSVDNANTGLVPKQTQYRSQLLDGNILHSDFSNRVNQNVYSNPDVFNAAQTSATAAITNPADDQLLKRLDGAVPFNADPVQYAMSKLQYAKDNGIPVGDSAKAKLMGGLGTAILRTINNAGSAGDTVTLNNLSKNWGNGDVWEKQIGSDGSPDGKYTLKDQYGNTKAQDIGYGNAGSYFADITGLPKTNLGTENQAGAVAGALTNRMIAERDVSSQARQNVAVTNAVAKIEASARPPEEKQAAIANVFGMLGKGMIPSQLSADGFPTSFSPLPTGAVAGVGVGSSSPAGQPSSGRVDIANPPIAAPTYSTNPTQQPAPANAEQPVQNSTYKVPSDSGVTSLRDMAMAASGRNGQIPYTPSQDIMHPAGTATSQYGLNLGNKTTEQLQDALSKVNSLSASAATPLRAEIGQELQRRNPSSGTVTQTYVPQSHEKSQSQRDEEQIAAIIRALK